jgi:hypothetical protein
MTPERQPAEIRLTGMHINLVDRIVTLEAQDGRKARLSFGEPQTLFQAGAEQQAALPIEAATPDELVAEPEEEAWEEPPAATAPSPEADAAPDRREQQPTVVLSGRLRTKPREGRPDNQGRPTAWARLAVHEEGAEQAHLYSATFHRHTAAIALGLDRGAQLTVEGYPHAGDAARKRLDTLSVIALHQYPGKPESQKRRAVRRG